MSSSHVLLMARARRMAGSGEAQRIRMSANLSLAEVAAAIGVATSTLWRWEHGDRSPRGDAAAEWVKLLEQLQNDMAVA